MKIEQMKKEQESVCAKKEHKIKSLFCYGNADIKKMIWSMKTDKSFYMSDEGQLLIETLGKEVISTASVFGDMSTDCIAGSIVKTILICVPSSSFWQSKKGFDHMHVFVNKAMKVWHHLYLKNLDYESIHYIPHAIIPRLNKNLQKGLNKENRQIQTVGAYGLSNYFKYFLKRSLGGPEAWDEKWQILILDDVKTTGSTLNECAKVVEEYIEKNVGEKVEIRCLTIAYEA